MNVEFFTAADDDLAKVGRRSGDGFEWLGRKKPRTRMFGPSAGQCDAGVRSTPGELLNPPLLTHSCPPHQKSNVTLNLANRAAVIDKGLRYCAVGLMSVGEYVCWYTSVVLELVTL
jgi:hypothetical protein